MYKIVLGLTILVGITLTTGCTYDFVTEAARTSTASFLVDIFQSAVNATVGP
ncbi:MAG: hypothetical protein KJ749_02630 [Planctomycetes bacterium]|nr:hypothetical protein [Planctomycetota bacterium]